jgi:hypothetical protein
MIRGPGPYDFGNEIRRLFNIAINFLKVLRALRIIHGHRPGAAKWADLHRRKNTC